MEGDRASPASRPKTGQHRSDQQEFYQLLSYKGDVDLEAKLNEWGTSKTSIAHTERSMAKRPMKPSANGYNHAHSMSREIVGLTMQKVENSGTPARSNVSAAV